MTLDIVVDEGQPPATPTANQQVVEDIQKEQRQLTAEQEVANSDLQQLVVGLSTLEQKIDGQTVALSQDGLAKAISAAVASVTISSAGTCTSSCPQELSGILVQVEGKFEGVIAAEVRDTQKNSYTKGKEFLQGIQNMARPSKDSLLRKIGVVYLEAEILQNSKKLKSSWEKLQQGSQEEKKEAATYKPFKSLLFKKSKDEKSIYVKLQEFMSDQIAGKDAGKVIYNYEILYSLRLLNKCISSIIEVNSAFQDTVQDFCDDCGKSTISNNNDAIMTKFICSSFYIYEDSVF